MSLIQLQTGGSKTPLFCFPGLGGHATGFVPLARACAGERPVYGLQGLGLEKGQRPQSSIEAMAAYFRMELQETQPHGPYVLAGWSMGGLVALETAQVLAASGECVALVALLDTCLPSRNSSRSGPTDDSGIPWIASRLNLPLSELKGLSVARQWDRIAGRANEVDGNGVADIRRLAAACQAHLAAIACHRPRPYSGRAVLFRIAGRLHHSDKGWRAICPQLRVERVSGNHYTMLRKPHVEILAGTLRLHIAAAIEGVRGTKN